MHTEFTATDALALDVEQVENWAKEVVADGDAPTPLLVSLVTRLRSAADLLADYLFTTSAPAAEVKSGCGPAAPNCHGAGPEVKGKRCDSGGRPQGRAEREQAERPRTPGNLQSPLPSPVKSPVGAFHE